MSALTPIEGETGWQYKAAAKLKTSWVTSLITYNITEK